MSFSVDVPESGNREIQLPVPGKIRVVADPSDDTPQRPIVLAVDTDSK